MFNKKTIRDVPVKDQIVLVRTDYNVPQDEDGNLTDDLRVQSNLPTIEYLLEHKAAKIILASHLGRPDGARVPKLSLKPVAKRLQELLPNTHIEFVDDNCGPDVESAVENLPKGGIILLENLRFSPGEDKNSEDFAHELVESTHATLFVQDGFAVAHRKSASTDAITRLLPAVAGLLMEKEVSALSTAINDPKHPLLVIIGGAKVDDKQPMIDTFKPIADKIDVGGKIAADGFQDDDTKVYVAEDFAEDETGAKLDIGQKSIDKMVADVQNAAMIVWNGLLGMTEREGFAEGSRAIAIAMGKSNATTIIGGGDTGGYVENLVKEHPELELKYSLISTGGGASLDLLSGKPLPGLDALEDK